VKTFIAALITCCIAVPSHAADVFLSLTRGDLPVSDAPTNTEIITSQDFEKTTARTVADVIESEPGVLIQKTGSEGQLALPSIRGFNAGQVLVVIDDVPQIPDYTGNVDLSRIPLNNVDRIEILRGGSSAVYGPNAEGGVIHIITKRPITAVDVEATSEAGSYGTYHNRLLVGTNQGPVQAQVSGSRDLSDGFQQNSTSRNTDLNGLFTYNAGQYGKLSYNIDGEKGTVGLPSGTPVPISDWNGSLERQANDLTASQTETDRNNRLQYTNQIGPVDLTARIANNIKDLDTFQFGSETLTRTEGRNAFGKVEIPGQGALGYEFYERRLDSNVYGVYRTDAWGTFYEAYFIRNDWIKLTPGVRYDFDNTYGESWSPRVELVVNPTEIWKVSASADRSFQAPTLADQFNPFVPPQFQPGHLNPEITWSYNLGSTVKPAPGLETTLNLYHTDTRDRIALDPNRNFAAFNLDRAYTQGVETDVAYTYKMVRQRVGYSYLQAEGKDASTNYEYSTLAFSPKHKIDYRADVNLPWQTQTTLDLLYVFKQWTNIGETGVEIPDYLVANLKLSKKIGWAEVFVACNNLLDRHYAETADAFEGFFPQPGRTYSGGMTIRFLR
jgi:outer membrane receptor protein involved in Fe transport